MEPATTPLLELRIHGVGNTPPHRTLDVRAADVVQAGGDTLGSFWTLTPQAAARDRALPPGDVHALRADVRREAYTWGALARLGGVPFGGAVGTVARLAVRALWALIVPFGLANVAYWARRVPSPEVRAADRPDRRVLPETTAALARLFSLALTLLLVATAATVVLSTVGTECMRSAGSVVLVCGRLPEALYGLARLDHGDRLGMLSLVPVLLVVALVLVARSGQVRFDDRYSVRAGRVSGVTWGAPLLRAGFWTVRAAGGPTLWAHLAGTLGLVAVLLAWRADVGPDGRAVAWLGAGVVAAAAVLAALRTDDDGVEVVPPAWRRPAVGVALLAGLGAWAAAWAVSARLPDVDAGPGADRPSLRLTGIEVVPALLGAVILGIAASALVWRLAGRLALLCAVVPVVAVAGVAVVTLVPGLAAGTRTGLVLTALGALAVPGLAALFSAAVGWRAVEGWGGAGPGVVLLASAATAAVYSSLAVLGARWLLGGGARPGRDTLLASTGAGGDIFVPVPRTVPPRPELYVPPVYAEFGAATVVVLGVFVLLALVVAAPALLDLARGRRVLPVAPRTDLEPGPATPAGARVVRARLVAALAHRVELAIGALAVASWLALALTIPLRTPADRSTGIADAPPLLLGLTVPALGLVAVALVASSLLGGDQGQGRPWGLVWDVMGFLPRSAHPFGPPSYAGRAVPELRSRVDSWLAAADVPAGPEREAAAGTRRVVLSAHSMGAVLAAAVVLIRAGDPAGGTDAPVPDRRVGLVTYGVQLRAFFGRFFPELLGPRVLGTPPSTGPAWVGDPWAAQVTAPPSSGTPGRATLLGLLTPGRGPEDPGARGPDPRPAWANLWRRTDPIGFPAYGYGENPVDRGAEEVDRAAYAFRVAGHTDYPRAWAYHRAFDVVVDRIR